MKIGGGTYTLGRIQEHEYQHHDVVRCPAHDECHHDDDGYPEGLHLRLVYQPLTVRVRAPIVRRPVDGRRIDAEDFFTTCKTFARRKYG